MAVWSPQTDPLGLNLQQEASAKRWQDAVNGLTNPFGPLPDPRWDSWFQAIKDKNPGKNIKTDSSIGLAALKNLAPAPWSQG